MKIYVVRHRHRYEGSEDIGYFRTLETARKFKEERLKKMHEENMDHYKFLHKEEHFKQPIEEFLAECREWEWIDITNEVLQD